MVGHDASQKAGSRNAAPALHSVPVQLPAPALQQWRGDSSTTSHARVSVIQPVGCGDSSVGTVKTETHLEILTQHVARRLFAVPSASAAAEVKVLVGSDSGITSMSEELVEALRKQPGMAQTALTHAFVRQRVW